MKITINNDPYKSRKLRIITHLSLFLILTTTTLFAQEHHHEHARNEIGISPGVSYSPSHKSWGFGIHAHYFRTLGSHSPWAIGGSLEQVSSHGTHWTIGAGARYQFLDRLSVAIVPGITFFGHDTNGHDHDKDNDPHTNHPKFTAHFELVYDLIHLEHFHFGPAADYSWSKHDAHFMLGIHCAYAF